jgi:hypothetical protein
MPLLHLSAPVTKWWSKLVAKGEAGPRSPHRHDILSRARRGRPQVVLASRKMQLAISRVVRKAERPRWPARSVALCDTAAGRLRLFSGMVPAGRGASCCLKTAPSKE